MKGAKTLCRLNYGQRLREEISHVPDAANVLHSELEAANPILEPRKTHVARLRHFWLNGAIGQAHGDFIVAMNRRGRLRVAKVGEHLSLLVCDLGSGKRALVVPSAIVGWYWCWAYWVGTGPVH
jgi:hypothetical protein